MSQCPFANLVDPKTYSKGMPYQALADIRHEAGLVKMDDPITGVPYWAVMRQKELDFISKNPQLFSSAERSAFPMESDNFTLEYVHRHMIINMDPPMHQKYRRIVRRAFTPSAVDSYAEQFKEHAKRIVSSVLARGECEFVEEVAAELPLLAILELLGIPTEDRKDFFNWTNTMIFADDPDMSTTPEEGQIAATHVLEYAKKLAAKHRESPQNNIVGALLDGSVGNDALTEDEFCWFFVLLLVGGNESTRTVISHGMRLLMENPDQLQFLVENPQHIAAATEEMLRYNTAFIAMRRTATQDVEVSGQQIKKGDKLVLVYHSAGHDEDVFGPDAMKFNIHRAIAKDITHDHRAFGIGQHFCIGSHLARLELRTMFEEIIPRIRNPKFAEPTQFVSSFFVNAVKKMPITFTPVSA